MLGVLTEKMHGLFSKLAGKKKLTEESISEAVSEVRLALLEADVNYSVAKTLVKRVKDKALGDTVIKSVSPGQQFIKIVHDELVALMGGSEAGIHLEKKPAIIMMCGLQGSGKTTHTAKLAKYLKKKGEAKTLCWLHAICKGPPRWNSLKCSARKSCSGIYHPWRKRSGQGRESRFGKSQK